MKKSMFLLVAVAMVAACGSESDVTVADDVREVTFRVDGDFKMTISEMDLTRTALTDEGNVMTDLWVFDYMGDELVQTIHQTAADDGWGQPSIPLKMGAHHVYFVASRGTEPTIEGTTMQWVKPSDTFWKDLELNVTATTANSRTVELDRVVTRIRVVATDEVPADVATVAVTPAMWYYGIDYRTGEPAVARQDNERSVAVLASYIGTQGTLAVNIFGFSGAEWTTAVTVTSKKSDGTVISSATVSDVPFKKNRSTEMIGAVFAKVGVNTITLNDEWLNAFGVEF